MMHIERTATGYNLRGEWFDIPLVADNDEGAVTVARELLQSDWLRDRVPLPDLGCRKLQVITRPQD